MPFPPCQKTKTKIDDATHTTKQNYSYNQILPEKPQLWYLYNFQIVYKHQMPLLKFVYSCLQYFSVL